MRVLVTAASRHGGTAEVATELGARLRELADPRVTVDVRPIGDVVSLSGYDAVVLGSGVYVGRWLEEARDFVSRHAAELRAVSVWLFSSGPVGTPLKPDDSHVVDLASVIAAVAPVEHRVFAGRIDRNRLGFAERTAVRALRVPAGDFRDWAAVRVWAGQIAQSLVEDAPLAGAQAESPVRVTTGELAS